MKPGLTCGMMREVAVEVTERMCPAFDGVVVHRVCSTWEMIHQMELAARKLLVDYLESDEEGIGSRVCVDHKAPAPIGTRMTVRAEATQIERNRVVCRVTAWDEYRLLGEGEQVQVVLKKKELERLIERRARSGQTGGRLQTSE